MNANKRCPLCSKIVYSQEMMKANDCHYHKFCFKCKTCKKTLSASTFSSHNGELFCATHIGDAIKGSAPAGSVAATGAGGGAAAGAAGPAPGATGTTATAPAPQSTQPLSKDPEEARLLRAINNKGNKASSSNTRANRGWGGRKLCPVCDKTVYQMEEIKANEKLWHKLCFKCTTCKKTLGVSTYKFHEGRLYCESHLPRFIVAEGGLREEERPATSTDHITAGAAAESSRMESRSMSNAMRKVGQDLAQAEVQMANLQAGGSGNVKPLEEGAKCTTCGEELTQTGMRDVKTGLPYCQPCWNITAEQQKKDRGGICFKCGGKAPDGMVKAGGQKYHVECFTCAGCEAQFAEAAGHDQSGVYIARDGLPYCDDCNHHGVCAACDEFIRSDMVMEVTGKPYHPACLQCQSCGVPLEKFVLKGEVMYCLEHDPDLIAHQKAAAEKAVFCAGCSEQITGKSKKAVGKKWHEACLNCAGCQKNVSGTDFYKWEDSPYCAPCYRLAAAGVKA